jgi:hypothetical protein
MKAKRYLITIVWFMMPENLPTVIDVEERFLEMMIKNLPMRDIKIIKIEENN